MILVAVDHHLDLVVVVVSGALPVAEPAADVGNGVDNWHNLSPAPDSCVPWTKPPCFCPLLPEQPSCVLGLGCRALVGFRPGRREQHLPAPQPSRARSATKRFVPDARWQEESVPASVRVSSAGKDQIPGTDGVRREKGLSLQPPSWIISRTFRIRFKIAA